MGDSSMRRDTSQPRSAGGAAIRIEGARVQLGQTLVLDGLSLDVAAGECIALLGSSGSGKTTILRLLAGLVPAERGGVYLDDREISALPPEHRGMAMIHQRFLLFPHLSVSANVAFGLPYRGVPKSEHQQRVDGLLDLVGLHGLGGRYPHELSGGQQQRVAIARALATRPRVLLLDEPLNSLDQPIRERLLDELRALHRAEGWTMVYVTHDQAEAARIAARVALLEGGQILQVAPYETLRERPASAAVARVLGLRNVVPAERRDNHLALPALALRIPWPDTSTGGQSAGPMLAYLPPDQLLPDAPGDASDRANTHNRRVIVEGVVDEIVALPLANLVVLRRGTGTLQAVVTRATVDRHGIVQGATVRVSIDPAAIHLLPSNE
jgi:putative spermidine/putrescine transport system ATP-binding protein